MFELPWRGPKANKISQSNLSTSMYSAEPSSVVWPRCEYDGNGASGRPTGFFFPAAAEACGLSSRPARSVQRRHSSSLPSDPDIVHENLKMGSDGESDQASGTSSDEVQSPTGVCLRNRGNRRISAEVGLALLWFLIVFLLLKKCSHNQ